MLPIDASTLFAIARKQSGTRKTNQAAIITAIGPVLATTLAQSQIDTPLRIAHFLAQAAHESDSFCTTQEYASGTAYNGRADLGNTTPGDGPRYKGRGLFQLTGRANYRSFGALLHLDLEDDPTLAAEPVVSLRIACAFWTTRTYRASSGKRLSLNQLADADDITAITKVINGGQNGLDDRIFYLKRAKAVLADLAADTVAPGPTPDQPVLHLGDVGPDVAALQRLLAARGYPIAIDGDFGPATLLAVQHLQATAGLGPDGIVGARTWPVLSANAVPATPVPAPAASAALSAVPPPAR
ncbi:peptidoglycan-binding protein [Methylobacterium sp. DB0501]|nr:peptidoglycan-binding protein [Methylobacterium sp. DB0501]